MEELPPECIVVLLAEDKGHSPGSHKEPAGIIALHSLSARHAVALGQRQHLRRIFAAQDIVLLLEGAVLRWCVVLVAGHDIDIRVTRIPVIVVELRCPDVYEVVHAALHQVSLRVEVKLLEGLGAVVAPPEPCLAATVRVACSLVEGTPQDGDALLLIVEQVTDDSVEVLVDDALLGRALLHSPFCREERARSATFSSRWRIEGEAVLRRQVGTDGDAPVPDETHDAACIMPGLGRRPHVVEVTLSEVLEVEDVDGGILAGTLIDAVSIGRVVVPSRLTARQHLLAPHLVAQVAIELPRRSRRFAVDGLLLNLGLHR